MKKSAAQLLRDAQDLTERQRVLLIEKLLDAWEPPDDPVSEDSFMAEIDRRTREIESGTARLLTWEEVKKRARAAVRGKR
jgi:putative addiction module component (TIGR02574 family)